MKTVRQLCQKCSEETKLVKRHREGTGQDLKDWINQNKSQIALLGI